MQSVILARLMQIAKSNVLGPFYKQPALEALAHKLADKVDFHQLAARCAGLCAACVRDWLQGLCQVQQEAMASVPDRPMHAGQMVQGITSACSTTQRNISTKHATLGSGSTTVTGIDFV
jgi:hypothetical protein